MPHIPQIISDTAHIRREPEPMPGISVGAAQLPGEAAARLGDAATTIGEDLAQKQIELRRSRQVIQSSSSAAVDANAFINSQLNDPDYGTFPDRVQAGLKEIHDQYADEIKDPEAKLSFDQSFARLTTDQVISARSEARKRENQADVATLDDSLTKLTGLAVSQTGPSLDAMMATARGQIASRVAGGILTAQQGQDRWKAFSENISDAKALQDIRNDPHAALKNLEAGEYPDLDAVRRQRFMDEALDQANAKDRQAVSDLKQQQAEADKALKLQQEHVVSDMTSKALNGKLSHQELEDARTRYGLSREDYEHTFDLIDKRDEKGAPSDPDTLAATTLAIRSTTPKITKEQLADDYRNGKLNLPDYTKLDTELTSNLRYNDEQAKTKLHYDQTQAESVISQRLGLDRDVESAARQEFMQQSAATGGNQDPMQLAGKIIQKYQPMVEDLNGQTRAGAISQFNSARGSYQSALDAQWKWNSGIVGALRTVNPFETNPFDAQVEARKEDLLNKAKLAHRDLGPAPKGQADGPIIGKDGTPYLVVGGRTILQ